MRHIDPRLGPALATVVDALASAGLRATQDDAGLRVEIDGQSVRLARTRLVDPSAAADDPFQGAVALDVALSMLLQPTWPATVRPTARRVGRSASRVSQALERFRDHGLVRTDGRPAVPDLFWSVAGTWHGPSIAVRALPDLAVAEGWALGGVHAAASTGYGIDAGESDPFTFHVPDSVALQRGARELGAAACGEARALLRVAPSRVVCLDRLKGWHPDGWALAHPVVTALDLATGTAAGPSPLAVWEPRMRGVDVWRRRD
jgi:hypothetical protein